MKFPGWTLSALVLLCSSLPGAQQQAPAVERGPRGEALPSSGGYKPYNLSLTELLESDLLLQQAFLSLTQSGDKPLLRKRIMALADAGDVGAELMLAEGYIPEQCTYQINRDVPNCGKKGDEPQVIIRVNPLGIEASYEKAAIWLEKASAQGSGEASEVLAQLITRMHANGHGTSYTEADSSRLHALARSRGYDVAPIRVTCYKLLPGGNDLKLGKLPAVVLGALAEKPLTDEELAALKGRDVFGSLLYEGGGAYGESVLTRPEGPVAHVRIILDHAPGREVLLKIPNRRDVIYFQRGDQFLQFPGDLPGTPRFISLMTLGRPASQVSVFTQMMDGGYMGGSCTSFP